MRKKIIERILEKGISARTAGKTTNARSGPARGISDIYTPESVETYPIKLKMVKEAKKPQATVNKGIIMDVCLTS